MCAVWQAIQAIAACSSTCMYLLFPQVGFFFDLDKKMSDYQKAVLCV